jgi:hypothetical protein
VSPAPARRRAAAAARQPASPRAHATHAHSLRCIVCSDLNGSELTGGLPSSWPSSFPELDSLRLSNNRLSGPLPASWANFTQLLRLVLKPGNDGLCGPVQEPELPFQRTQRRSCSSFGLAAVERMAQTGRPLVPCKPHRMNILG